MLPEYKPKKALLPESGKLAEAKAKIDKMLAEDEAKEAEKKAEIEAKKVEAGPNQGVLASEAAEDKWVAE